MEALATTTTRLDQLAASNKYHHQSFRRYAALKCMLVECTVDCLIKSPDIDITSPACPFVVEFRVA